MKPLKRGTGPKNRSPIWGNFSGLLSFYPSLLTENHVVDPHQVRLHPELFKKSGSKFSITFTDPAGSVSDHLKPRQIYVYVNTGLTFCPGCKSYSVRFLKLINTAALLRYFPERFARFFFTIKNQSLKVSGVG